MYKLKNYDWPKEIRLIINKECNYCCSFPGSGRKWCHEDGVHCKKGGNKKEVNVEDYLFLSKVLKESFNLEKAKVGAMEPLLYKDLGLLLSGLKKDLNFDEVSLTTNGYLLDKNVEMLEKSGLDNLTISIHAFNASDYRDITGVDAFDRVKKCLEDISKQKKFKSIKINRVLLRLGGVWQDLQNFFDWATEYGFVVKLYKLLWSKTIKNEDYFKYYLPWESLMVYLKERARLIETKNYNYAGRERLFWQLDSGLKLETDVFLEKKSKERANVCKKCELASFCQEGILSYGLEINDEMVLSACLLRDDLCVDLYKEVKERNEKMLRLKVGGFVYSMIK